jgi:hypothetical protein
MRKKDPKPEPDPYLRLMDPDPDPQHCRVGNPSSSSLSSYVVEVRRETCWMTTFISLGMDEAWSVGTEMRQLTILRPEVQSSALFRTVLMDDIRRYSICDRIFKQCMGARNRVGIGLSYRPVRLQRLAELILNPWAPQS